jgi:ABC-type Fe3+-hydroxamate transport system substrate-binding protein
MSRYSLLSILFLILFSGLASAGAEQVLSPSGSSDQITINQALESVYNLGGGTVYLNSGTYNILDSRPS